MGAPDTKPLELITLLGQPWGLTSFCEIKALWPKLPALVGGQGQEDRRDCHVLIPRSQIRLWPRTKCSSSPLS